MKKKLTIATWNIHKGFSQFNRRMVVHELRDCLRGLSPDIVFLQEVQGLHAKHAKRHKAWPAEAQHDFLAEDVWLHRAYGKNVVRDHRHHGNAILSRFPIVDSHNQDVTHLWFEKRGLLHCVVQPSGWTQPLHCVCVHLSLFGISRRRQMNDLATRLDELVPPTAPVLIAGDFNDWSNQAHDLLGELLGVSEVFTELQAQPSRSFPATFPLFRLDRIYQRGLHVQAASLHSGPPWSRISDHAALSAELSLRHGD